MASARSGHLASAPWSAATRIPTSSRLRSELAVHTLSVWLRSGVALPVAHVAARHLPRVLDARSFDAARPPHLRTLGNGQVVPRPRADGAGGSSGQGRARAL